MARNGTIWDPLRKRDVALTPEETVRQWFIGFMRTQMRIPAHMMMSEVALAYGGKAWRADIVAYDRAGRPLMVVECKRPGTDLGQEAAGQALRYTHALDVDYIAVTNGTETYLFGRGPGGFACLDRVPEWEEMLWHRR